MWSNFLVSNIDQAAVLIVDWIFWVFNLGTPIITTFP